MAAITALTPVAADRLIKAKSGAAQADTGQTTWILTPPGTRYAEVILNVTAVAGTTPIILPAIYAGDPFLMDDANKVAFAALTTSQTGAGMGRILIGPGVTGIANVVVWGASAGADAYYNTIVPRLLGINLTMDRTTGDEKYTYDLLVRFIGE